MNHGIKSRMLRAVGQCALMAMLVVFVGDARQARGADGKKLVWRGCGVSKKAFMEACASAYEKQTGVKIQLSGGGATLGIEAAGTGGANIGGTCRGCLNALNEQNLNLRLTIAAWDALVAIVHPDNPIENLTREQLISILQQKTTDWSNVGGPEGRIVVVARKGKTSGVGHMARRLILGDSDADFGPKVVRLNSSGPVEKMVQRVPSAIAISGISSAKQREIKILSIDGVKPTVENIASGKYPYYRPLYLAFQPDCDEPTRRFLDWILSDAGQAIIAAQGTVNLSQGAGLIHRFRHFDNPKLIENLEVLQHEAQAENKTKTTATAG